MRNAPTAREVQLSVEEAKPDLVSEAEPEGARVWAEGGGIGAAQRGKDPRLLDEARGLLREGERE